MAGMSGSEQIDSTTSGRSRLDLFLDGANELNYRHGQHCQLEPDVLGVRLSNCWVLCSVRSYSWGSGLTV